MKSESARLNVVPFPVGVKIKTIKITIKGNGQSLP
jgi:hypothetical protein